MRWWRRRKQEENLDRELRAHLELETEEQQDSGLSPVEARYAARRALGNATLVKEDVREAWGWVWWEQFKLDIHYELRQIRHNPGFSAIAIATLALGIGANTAMFSVVYAVLIDPMPYPEAHRLVVLSAKNSAGARISFSYPDFMDWKSNTQVFEKLAAYQAFGFTLTGGGDAERLPGRTVSAEFFSTLGVAPLLGRDFQVEDDRPGARAVVILNHQTWQRSFDAIRKSSAGMSRSMAAALLWLEFCHHHFSSSIQVMYLRRSAWACGPAGEASAAGFTPSAACAPAHR